MKKILILIFFFGILSEVKGQATLYVENNTALTLSISAGAADDCSGTDASSTAFVTLAPGNSVWLYPSSGDLIIGVTITGYGVFFSTCGVICGASVPAPFTMTWYGPCATNRLIIS